MWTRSHIKVFEGVLGVTVNGQSTLVGAGKMIGIRPRRRVEKFDKEDTDSLDHWAKRRAELIAMANASSAKQVHDYGCAPTSHQLRGGQQRVGANSPCSNPCNSWRYNPWYGLITYIPCGNNIYSPYGYRYWSPYNVMRAYYVPPARCSTMAAAVSVAAHRRLHRECRRLRADIRARCQRQAVPCPPRRRRSPPATRLLLGGQRFERSRCRRAAADTNKHEQLSKKYGLSR